MPTEIFAKLSPRFTGGDAEGRGGSGTIAVLSDPSLEHREDPPLSLRDISPRRAGGEQNGRGYRFFSQNEQDREPCECKGALARATVATIRETKREAE